jgi:hypothetical protein
MKKNRIYGIILVVLLACQSLLVRAANKEFAWSASATMTSNYLWRGLYCGGLSLQADAQVSYYGFFANMWWSVGASDWAFADFNPEIDLTVGFSRGGLSIYYIHMYYFDHYVDGSNSKFFDMKNYAPGGGGTTGEWRVKYRVSDRVPLSILVGCRTFGRDGYLDQNGDLKRAYSSYIELGYDVILKDNWALLLRLGMTPAKSLYTGFQGDFAVHHLGAQLTKTWTLGTSTNSPDMTAFAHVMLNPWNVNKDNLILPVANAGDQKLNLAVGCTVSL